MRLLRKMTILVSTHRGHGHCIAKGGDLKRMMAELMGKESGYSKGRGGSMHLFDMKIGLLGANGIVGGGIPIAVGAALSAKYRNLDLATLCFFGEGAANQGTFHESLNMASLWKLPVVFICENNLYAHLTPVSKSLSVQSVAARAVSYGFPGKTIDGNDVLKVYNAVCEAVRRARINEGPTLIECETYRHERHCMVALDTRPQIEIKKWKSRDPITRFGKRLLEDATMTSEEQEKLKLKIRYEIDEAEEFARESEYANMETLEQNSNSWEKGICGK